uniref:Islet cell autoantigen 1 n=1 Tax=Aceria tosichella TaxID=561515 RepID=A0A6G1SJJ1_9ACAR
MASGSIGMSGRTFDAFVSSQTSHNEPDWAAKIQEKYWKARQKFLAKIEKNEDNCIVLSDSKLDAKLEIYRSIDSSCGRLTNILESYQNSLFMFANEENALGILLKECGRHDKTKAGKIMSITGRGLTQSSHQRIRLYMPLLRLYQEMETFHTRAVEDTADTVDKLENSRSQYRASLLWMKDISEKLNPDVYKQLNRFRRVQSKVRDDKRVFDSMQMDVVQKIDLLMASRCNLMNQILAPYQAILLETFERNHNNFKSINDLIKNENIYEYEFKTLKQLNPLRLPDEDSTATAGESNTKEEILEENLLGTIDEEGREKDVNNDNNSSNNANGCSRGQDSSCNLIDVSLDEHNQSRQEETKDEPGDTFGLLESLFGNRKTDPGRVDEDSRPTPAGDVDDREKKLVQHDDLKVLMSSIDANLFHEEGDEEKQIASLLGPSENLRKINNRRIEQPIQLMDDDDIFARWARDADIDLSSDEKKDIVSASGLQSETSTNAEHKDQDKNVDLMDIGTNLNNTDKKNNNSRFYA